jgi:hypothetical protein
LRRNPYAQINAKVISASSPLEMLVIANVMRRADQLKARMMSTAVTGRERFSHHASHFVRLSMASIVSHKIDT